MSRILIVAKSEFLTIVRTKAFIIGLLMAPLLIGLSVGFQLFAARRSDVEDHRFAVVDRTGVLFDALSQAADVKNGKAFTGTRRTGPRFLPVRIDPQSGSVNDLRLQLSEEVRRKALFGFVEIPAALLDAGRPATDAIDYFTETPSYTALPDWIRETLEREAIARRFAAASMDVEAVAPLSRRATVTTSALVERRPDGSVSEAKRTSSIQTFVAPFALMYLLFIALMTSAPQLLNAIIEEKMSRISEVLISSITPFQLMAGKLLGVSAVSFLLALIYLGGGIYLAVSGGEFDLVRPALIGWFVLFLLCAVLIYGSLFISVGASCSDLKDAQSMLQPVMIFLFLPLLASQFVLRAPNATVTVVMSLIPPWTPFLMLLRLALTPAPPVWQVLLGFVLTVGAAAACVYAAGKIFRIGLLMQGKPPTLPEMLRWIRQ